MCAVVEQTNIAQTNLFGLKYWPRFQGYGKQIMVDCQNIGSHKLIICSFQMQLS